MIRAIVLPIVGCLFLVACNSSERDRSGTGSPVCPEDIREIAANYESLTAVTNAPVFVNAELAMLCVGASAKQVDTAREKYGPHAHCSVKIFMNDLAAAAFEASSMPFPEGSVIVKQKKLLPFRSEDGSFGTDRPDGVGAMIKRQAGFNASHGDWEYFYFSDPGEIEFGESLRCAECHDAAKPTDNVFGTWKTVL